MSVVQPDCCYCCYLLRDLASNKNDESLISLNYKRNEPGYLSGWNPDQKARGLERPPERRLWLSSARPTAVFARLESLSNEPK